MRFELTKDFLDQLREKIAEQEVHWIREHILELHYADIAEILDMLSNEEGKYIYFQLDEDVQADVLMELEEDVRDRFLASLSTKEIADQLENRLIAVLLNCDAKRKMWRKSTPFMWWTTSINSLEFFR